jgi:hypothetical protein
MRECTLPSHTNGFAPLAEDFAIAAMPKGAASDRFTPVNLGTQIPASGRDPV